MALVLLKQGGFSEEANQLVRQVLEVDPSHQKGLALAGGIEYSRKNFLGAAEIWQKLLILVKDDLEYSRSIEDLNLFKIKVLPEPVRPPSIIQSLVSCSTDCKILIALFRRDLNPPFIMGTMIPASFNQDLAICDRLPPLMQKRCVSGFFFIKLIQLEIRLILSFSTSLCPNSIALISPCNLYVKPT